MAEDDDGGSGRIPGVIGDLVAQLRGIAEGLEGLSGRIPTPPGARTLAGLRDLSLLPGSLTAAQMQTIAKSVSAQRRSIEALQEQLTAFDEQLAVLERILGPLAEWSRNWAEIQQRMLTLGRAAEAEGGEES